MKRNVIRRVWVALCAAFVLFVAMAGGQPEPAGRDVPPQKLEAAQEQLNDVGGTAADAAKTGGAAENVRSETADKRKTALAELVALGAALADAGHYEFALRAFSCALDLGEETPVVLFYIAYCHGELGSCEAAGEWYAKAAAAVEKQPEGYAGLLPKLYNNYGATLVELGKAEQALAWYQKAVQADADYAPVYFNLGLLHEQHLNKPAEAIKAYQRHVALGGGRGITARNAILRLQEKESGGKEKEQEPPVPATK